MREISISSEVNAPSAELVRAVEVARPLDVHLKAGDHSNESRGKASEYARLLRKYKWILILNALLCGAAAFFITRLQPPEYDATALVEINDTFNDTTGLQPSQPAPSNPSDSGDIEIQTQIEILHSTSLVGRVVSALKMDSGVPHGPSLTQRALAAIGFSVGAPATPRDEAVAGAQKQLQVTPVRGSRLVKIEFTAGDPALAAQFVNTLTHEFIEQHLELRLETTSRTSHWLSEQLQELQAKLQRSELELQNYAAQSGLVFTGDKDRTNVVDQKMRLIQEELAKAQADRIVKETRYELAKKSPPEALAEIVDNPAWHDYESKLATLRQQLADLQELYTPNYYKVRQVEAQIKELTGTISKSRTNMLQRIENEYNAASRREQLLLANYGDQTRVISDQDAKAVRYNILKDEVDTNRQLYDSMLQKLKALSVNSAIRASNLAVVDAARPPSSPTRPKPVINMAVGLMAGSFLALVFAAVRERGIRQFRAPSEAKAYLNLPELGVIPPLSLDMRYENRNRRRFRSGGNGNVNGLLLDNGEAELMAETAMLLRPPSLIAEAFRATLASILFATEENKALVLAITSAGPSEGKTTAAINLAIALTRIQRKVLLIDGDICRPKLHEIFHVANQAGLTDLLAQTPGTRTPAANIQHVVPGLDLLTSGGPQPGCSDSLQVGILRGLITELRQSYDAVLIDTPPVLVMSDARVISRCSDGVVFVTRMSTARREDALAAAQRLAADGARVIGTILNDHAPEQEFFDSYYRYRQS
jgi:capsular exopolysaccharide synthesis family protein